MFGTNFLVVKLRQECDLDAWVRGYVPNAAKKEHAGVVYYELPVIPWFGPARPCIAADPLDSHKVVCGLLPTETTSAASDVPHQLCDFLGGRNGVLQPPRWMDEWQNVRDGAVSLICSDNDFDIVSDESTAPLLKSLQQVEALGVRCEFLEQSDCLSVRVLFGCESTESAVEVKRAVQSFVADQKATLPTQLPTAPSKVRENVNAALHSASVHVLTTDDKPMTVAVDFELESPNQTLGLLAADLVE